MIELEKILLTLFEAMHRYEEGDMTAVHDMRKAFQTYIITVKMLHKGTI